MDAKRKRGRPRGDPLDPRRQLALIGVRILVIRGVPTPVAEAPVDLSHLAMAQIRAGRTLSSGNLL